MIKVIYTPNPLEIKVILDDQSISFLREAIKCDLDDWEEDYPKNEVENEVEKRVKWCIEELQKSHAGDCISFPCTCSKCYAETMLNINTLPGWSKRIGNEIFWAFRKAEQDPDLAFKLLSAPYYITDPKFSHLSEKWNIGRTEAKEWLEKYNKNTLILGEDELL